MKGGAEKNELKKTSLIRVKLEKHHLLISGDKHELLWAHIGRSKIQKREKQKLLRIYILMNIIVTAQKSWQKAMRTCQNRNLMTIERRRILTKAFIEFAWLLSSCGCSVRNSDAKYVGNNMPRRFQNFSVCLGNTSAKKKCRRLSRNLCTLHWQWLRHTSAFCQGL